MKCDRLNNCIGEKLISKNEKNFNRHDLNLIIFSLSLNSLLLLC